MFKKKQTNKVNNIPADVFSSPSKAVQPQQTASFSQHGRLFRPPSRGPAAAHKHSLPTCQRTIILKTHTHTLKTPASTHNNGAGCAAARRRHSGRKPRKRPLLCVFSWLRRNKLAARAATTKTSRSCTFHCKRLLNYFSETERNNKSEDFFSSVRG